MFRISHSVQTLAAPEEIWAFVKDFSKWPLWMADLKMVHMQGGLATGTQGLLYLVDDSVKEMLVQKFDLGFLEILVIKSFGVKLRFSVDISQTNTGCKIKMEGELLGFMSLFHFFGTRRRLKRNIVPMTRRLGIVGQEIRR